MKKIQKEMIQIKLFKRKYIGVYLARENDSFNVEKKVKLSSNTISIDYNKDNTFAVNISNPSYSKGLKSYFCFDVSTGNQLNFIKKAKGVDTKFINKILTQKAILEITTSLNPTNFKMNLIQIIFGALFGGLVGYIVGSMI